MKPTVKFDRTLVTVLELSAQQLVTKHHPHLVVEPSETQKLPGRRAVQGRAWMTYDFPAERADVKMQT